MCGRYTLRRINWYLEVKGFLPPSFEEFSETRIRFNIAPSHLVPIILNEAGTVIPREAQWGFVPRWAGDKPGRKPPLARCERIATSPMFRDAFNRHRCLVPVDGIYEWKGAKAPRIPHFIRMKDDSVFMLAGVRSGDTFAIITTDPNDVMRPIHDRMPMILNPRNYERWLNPAVGGKEVTDLLKPYAGDQMESYRVTTRVNDPKREGADLIEPDERPEFNESLWTQIDNPPKDR
jgi:putative SOS response-associated peptidase YedK